jgi:hypothetical protein
VTAIPAQYVYGIVGADASVPHDLRGVGGGAVTLVPYREIAAIVGVLDGDRPIGRRSDIVAHSEVLDAMAGSGAIIPVRFGSAFEDQAQVIEFLLAPQAERLLEILTSLKGTAQFTVRVRYDEPTVLGEVVSERADVAQLREETRGEPEVATYHARVRLGELVAKALESKREVDGQAVTDALVSHSVAWRTLAGSGLDHLIDVAFLVQDQQREDFEAAAEELAQRLAPRARVRLVGPVPPYDFVPEE